MTYCKYLQLLGINFAAASPPLAGSYRDDSHSRKITRLPSPGATGPKPLR